MKIAVLILVTMLAAGLMPASAQADTPAHDLTLLLSLAVIDYEQSVDMFYKQEGFHEMNLLLGEKPSRGDMIAFGVVGVGLTFLLADALPAPWDRILVDSVIASETFNIQENRRVTHGWNTEGPPLRGRELSVIPIVISLRF